MTTLHATIGYLLLAGAGIGLLWSAYQYAQRHPHADTDQLLTDIFLTGLYLETLLGLLLFLLSPGDIATIPAHPILSVVALGLTQWGRKPKGTSDRDQRLFTAGVYLFAGLLILIGIMGS
ncbi:MAG: hypothetical protein MAG451_02964 [Anaerolineales bacterium]|nr:hypothetical protein [Anaerolineales bacterium]